MISGKDGQCNPSFKGCTGFLYLIGFFWFYSLMDFSTFNGKISISLDLILRFPVN